MDERTARRFWSKVDRTDTCWFWTGCLTEWGYGLFQFPASMRQTKRLGMAHRFAYEVFVGPIPDGLVLDHLCRTPRCVNPAHLEPVTQRENLLRGQTFQAANAAKTHCPQGHPYDETNTRLKRGGRACRTCAREEQRRVSRRRGERRAARRRELGMPPYVERRKAFRVAALQTDDQAGPASR